MQLSKSFAAMCLAICSYASAQVLMPVELAPSYAKIPVSLGGLFNLSVDMTAEVFKPEGQEPFPVLVYSHGRSSTAQERAHLTSSPTLAFGHRLRAKEGDSYGATHEKPLA